MQLHSIDYAILFVYLVFVLGIGALLKRQMKTSSDFFLSGRSIPAWIAGLAFISANLGAQEVIGMGASGAKYGLLTAHFYWLGAIPAMVFVGLFMMPFYYGSRARSVPEYLRLRFDEKTRGLNAVSFAVMTVFSSGVSMYAMGKLLKVLLHWPFSYSILLSAAVVLAYTFLGGLTSAIYNEVVQFFLIVAGLLPLTVLGLIEMGGVAGLQKQLLHEATRRGLAEHALSTTWQPLLSPEHNPMGVDALGLCLGLGFVLSFGYFCTDFLVVQRALAARDLLAARKAPLIAALPKLLMPFLVIVPGMLAMAVPAPAPSLPLSLETGSGLFPLSGVIPPKIDDATGQVLTDLVTGHVILDYDLATPMLMARYFPPGLLGLGVLALLASFMSGMAGNTTAFNTVFTYDLYQSYVKPSASDRELLWMGRASTVFGIALSILAAFLAERFNNIMDLLQLVFAFINAPLFATFLLGMFTRRTNGCGAFYGLLTGTLAAVVHHGLTLPSGAVPGLKGGFVAALHTYRSEMAQNFWTAIVAWSVCFGSTVALSYLSKAQPKEDLVGLVYSLSERVRHDEVVWYRRPAVWAAGVLAATVALNLIFF